MTEFHNAKDMYIRAETEKKWHYGAFGKETSMRIIHNHSIQVALTVLPYNPHLE